MRVQYDEVKFKEGGVQYVDCFDYGWRFRHKILAVEPCKTSETIPQDRIRKINDKDDS